jgi:biopolymer transport protein ExbD
MKNSRRMRRMARNKKALSGLNLTSLMDVFTILVFFLLFNFSGAEVMEAPKQIKLPDSVVEAKPRETVVIVVGQDMVLVQGEAVAKTPELLDANIQSVEGVSQRLKQLERNIIGISTKNIVDSKEITIQADKSIPFKVLKKIMTTCTDSGYGRISLAVNQKAAQS